MRCLRRGRAVELMTDKRKERLCAYGVIGSFVCSGRHVDSSMCSSCASKTSETVMVSGGVVLACGGGKLNRARGRGWNAGVGVSIVEGAGEEKTTEGMLSDACSLFALLDRVWG